jgi:hypothetical protein
MRYVAKDEKEYLSIDDIIQKSSPSTRTFSTTFDRANQPISGILDNVESPHDTKMIENESEILSLLMKASGQSQQVVPSFYEGGDDVYIENKKVVDVTVTDSDRRAIHTISNFYNTLGIYRDDFDKNNNDKLARNSYYAICEKAMMDYMRSVQWSVKDSRNGDTIEQATDFFDNPNPQDSMGDIMSMLIRDVTRYDAGVIVKSFNKGGFVTEIKPYLATEFWREQDRVPFIINVPIMNTVDLTGGAYASHQQPTYQGWWSHGYTERFWQRSRTGVYIPFQPEEVAYFMMYPRTDGIYGTDFIKFLKYQIQYLIDSTKAAGKTFENGVVPSIVWEHPEVRTIPQLKQRIAELKYNNQGWQRFGSVIHTVNGEKVSSVAQSLHDMQWLEGQKFVAQLVWATWGFSSEEFMGGGENRATAYVKRNITKSRLLYPLMTFLEQRMNREILPYLKGYRKFWKFSFTRDIELDDENKVATTNSIKASTFLQYYQSGFPIEASMELAGLDKNQYKFNIGTLEAEIMQNQMMMLGQQPGEQGGGGEDVGGMENLEQGRYGAASEMYLGNEQGSSKGTGGPENTPRDPSVDEEQYKKADFTEREASAESNRNAGKKLQEENDASNKSAFDAVKTVAQLAPLVLAKKKKSEINTVAKSTTINPLLAGLGLGALVVRDQYHQQKIKQKNREANIRTEPVSTKHPADKNTAQTTRHVNKKIRFKDGGGAEEVDIPRKPQTPNIPSSNEGTGGTRATGISNPEPGSRTSKWNPKFPTTKSLIIDEPDEREDMNYNPYWLAEGIRVEMEHTNDPEIAKEIAKDHLDEFMDYYSSLRKMENALRSGNKPYQKVEMYKAGDMVKAKVYITHPSEAPKGRSVRRGNKGGYYYITNQRDRGGSAATGAGEHATKKKSSGQKGWGTGGGEAPSEGVSAEPPMAPDIEGAEMQVKISGNGIGIVVGIISGRLVASKLNTPQTAQFIKIVEKKSGEKASAEDIIELMVMTAEEMGLEVT